MIAAMPCTRAAPRRTSSAPCRTVVPCARRCGRGGGPFPPSPTPPPGRARRATCAGCGDRTLPQPARHSMEGRGGDHREAHNLYGLLMNRAGYEALRRQRPQHRPFVLTRSGWAGIQRYAWNWTGDVEGSWRGLRQTVATVLGLGLSGVPYTGPDIGGFSGSPSVELYVRWFQLAAFLPFFRTHSAKGTPRREPGSVGQRSLAVGRA